MKPIEELRKEFELTKLFTDIAATIGGVYYKSRGGYFVDDTPYFYLNGAFAMFQELSK